MPTNPTPHMHATSHAWTALAGWPCLTLLPPCPILLRCMPSEHMPCCQNEHTIWAHQPDMRWTFLGLAGRWGRTPPQAEHRAHLQPPPPSIRWGSWGLMGGLTDFSLDLRQHAHLAAPLTKRALGIHWGVSHPRKAQAPIETVVWTATLGCMSAGLHSRTHCPVNTCPPCTCAPAHHLPSYSRANPLLPPRLCSTSSLRACSHCWHSIPALGIGHHCHSWEHWIDSLPPVAPQPLPFLSSTLSPPGLAILKGGLTLPP